MENNDELRKKVLESITKTLIEKNKRYGNAALSPIGVFYRGTSTNSIAIRLDDKLSRIKNSDTLRKNDMFDLLGYLILYEISIRNLLGLTFVEQVGSVADDVINIGVTELVDVKGIEFDNVFDKQNTGDKNLTNLNIIYNGFKRLPSYALGGIRSQLYTLNFIIHLVDYFVVNNITDFDELLD